MIIFLIVILAIAFALFEPLSEAFFGNPVINGIILFTLAIGAGFILRQTSRLAPEYHWMNRARSGRYTEKSPALLATVAAITTASSGNGIISTQSLRSMLDGVAVRLDESRETSRYMIGLLVFLGLLGTFWGLLQTIVAVGSVVANIDTTTANFSTVMNEFKASLDAPLAGMATAFSSSLFGLAGSLILGFLDLQLGQALGRFYTDLEDWLSSQVRLTDGVYADPADAVLGTALSEEAADKMLNLTQLIAKAESGREQTMRHLDDLGKSLDKLAENLARDRPVAQNLENLEQAITILAREIREDRQNLRYALTTELRALSRVIASQQGAKKA